MTPHDDRNSVNWETVTTTVIKALRQRLGDGPGLMEAERFAGSAIGSAFRQMKKGTLELMPPEQLVRWLIDVAYHKYVTAIRHSGVERRHQGAVAERQSNETQERLEREAASAAAREEVDNLFAQATREERIVLEARLTGRTQAQIADAIAKLPKRKGKCSQATVSNIWQGLCKRLKSLDRGAEEFGERDDRH